MTQGPGEQPPIGAAADPYGEFALPDPPVAHPRDPVAVAALVSGLLCLAPVGLVLGVIALRRTRDGSLHGRPFAILAVTMSLIVLVVAPLAWLGSVVLGDHLPTAADVRPGDCVDLSEADSLIERNCSQSHRGEVAAVGELDTASANGYTAADAADFCAPLLEERYARAARTGKYAVGAVLQVDSGGLPRAGDPFACYLADLTGQELTGPIEVRQR